MLLFKFLWLFDTMMALVASAGFLRYLFNGPLQKNITITWLGLLLVMFSIVVGSVWLRVSNYSSTAWLLLGIMAAPGIVYVSLATATRLFRIKLRHL